MLVALIVFTLLSLISFYPLLVKKAWQELSIPLLILLIASFYAIQYHYDYNFLPNPGHLITKLYPVGEAIGSFFAIKS